MDQLILQAHSFAQTGLWEELRRLIDNTPQLAKLTTGSGHTLLTLCAHFPGAASAIIRLIELGADPNHVTGIGSTPLGEAVAGGSRFGLTTIPGMDALLSGGARIDDIAYNGMPALHWAIRLNRLDYAEHLLRAGANPDICIQDDPALNAEEVAFALSPSDREKVTQMIKRRRTLQRQGRVVETGGK